MGHGLRLHQKRGAMLLDFTHHPGMTNEAYHALKAVSPSRIKLLGRSPLHYYDQFLAEDRKPCKQTDAMRLGTVLHTAVLEPQLWDSTIAVPPHAFDRRTKAGEARAHAFAAENAGRLVLTPDDADAVRRMADAVWKHRAAAFLLEIPGRREPTYTWIDPETGLACKTRPDWHSDSDFAVVDLKSTKDASRVEFAKSIANLDYHVQAAWNRRALGKEKFLTIAVENSRPWAVAVYPASAAMLAAGERRIDRAMEQLAECSRSGVWPGYGDLIAEEIELPGWCRD